MRNIIVVPYDPKWPFEFNRIKDELDNALGTYALSIEHVGSSSVPGLLAKPIIDIDIVIKDYNCFEAVKEHLAAIGYTYNGDQGIKDRHAFKYSDTDKSHLMEHHLYVCPEYSEELKKHITFRDYLRTHDKDRDWYGEVKMLAAKYYPHDINSYMIAKHPCVEELLTRCSL